MRHGPTREPGPEAHDTRVLCVGAERDGVAARSTPYNDPVRELSFKFSMATRLRRTLVVFAIALVCAGAVLVGIAARLGDQSGLAVLLAAGVVLTPFLGAPVLSVVVLAVFVVPLCWWLRSKRKLRVGTFLLVLLVALVPTAVVSCSVHGQGLFHEVLYEVPVEVTFEPSDEAFEGIRSSGAPGVLVRWHDDEDDCGGLVVYPVSHRERSAVDSLVATAPLREPFSARFQVRYPNKLLGYAAFHVVGEEEHVAVYLDRRERLLTVPVRKGLHEIELTDSRGMLWKVTTRTLDDEARMVEKRASGM